MSGEPAAVRAILAECEREGVFGRAVQVDVASHSPQMEPIARSLVAELQSLAPAEAQVPFHSTVLGRQAHAGELETITRDRDERVRELFDRAMTRAGGPPARVAARGVGVASIPADRDR